MYKLLIVEDEEIIRWGLRNEIKWEEIGFEVIGEAENGKVAFDLITRLAPDAILLDIKMPLMNGIEFMSRVNSINPKIKIVILSGYDKFEYAKQSIEYGVFSYLLKPTKEDEIKEVFCKLKKELDHINSSIRELEILRKKANTISLIKKEGISEDKQDNIPDDIIDEKNNSNGADPLIQKVKEYMNKHYNERITLELLSNIVYMNPAYFSVYFKQKTGLNYTEYITIMRIEKAKELLGNKSLKVYEIANMVGYDDFRYFSRIFKKITGINPQRFRSLLK
ncbi:MAG: response regulator [Firmicutes bacterium]|nr:response regulator [Bacillota bacterium]